MAIFLLPQLLMIKHLNKIIAACMLLFIIQLAYVLIYLNVHQYHFLKHYHEAIIQEVLNITQMAKNTPAEKLNEALSASNSKRIKLSLSEVPIYTAIPHPYNQTQIANAVNQDDYLVNLSFKLPHHHWLNVHANLTSSPPIWPHFLTLLLEVIFATTLLFYAWSIRRFVIPLKKFRQAAEQLGVNLNTPPLEEFKGPSIIRETSTALNNMQKRIKDLLRDRTLMVAAISHDLRTPITRLSLRSQLLEDSEFKEKTLNDINELNKLISEVLTFSSTENSQEEKRKFELNAFIETLCSSLQDLKVKVTFIPSSQKIITYLQETSFKRALTNIIQNACKYGKEATVTLEKNKKNIKIFIDDKGEGLSRDEMQEVFSPFYRVEKSRNRKISGTGLGLAISKSAILAHQGEIIMENLKPKGLRVIIHLPITH